MLSADFPAEQSIEIPNNWASEHSSGEYWIANPNRGADIRNHGKQQSRPRGIMIDSRDEVDDTTWAMVRGILWAENDTDWKNYRLACNVVHPMAFKAINMLKTNARGIKILF